MREKCSWHAAPSAAQDFYFFAHPLVWFPLSPSEVIQVTGTRHMCRYLMAWLHAGKCFSVKSVVVTVSWDQFCSVTAWYLHETGHNREPLLVFLLLVCPKAKRTICMAEGIRWFRWLLGNTCSALGLSGWAGNKMPIGSRFMEAIWLGSPFDLTLPDYGWASY